MKNRKYWIRALLLIFCFTMLVSVSSCTADMNIGNNTELGEQFMNCLINNDHDAAYALVKNAVTLADFDEYWSEILPIAEGAKSYEMEQIGWNFNSTNGKTVRVTAYQVSLDNGKIALLRITTQDGIEGIAGLYISDITEFITRTNSFVPGVKVVLIVISVLTIAFSVWMLVDCVRRKIKYKVLWIILIFLGLSFTFTLGETVGLNFMVGLMFQMNSIVADPAILAVEIKYVVPLGAILYFALRKKFTIASNTAETAQAFAMDSDSEPKESSNDEM